MRTDRDRQGRRRRWRKRWRRVKSTRPSTWLVLALCVAVAVFATVVLRSPQSNDLTSAADASPRPAPTEQPQSLLVVGDSWTKGGPANTGPEWWEQLDLPDGWSSLSYAEGGVGYLGFEKGLDLRKSGRLAELAGEYDPDVALIALGRNDVNVHATGAVLREARTDLAALHRAWPDARIVVFAPFSPSVPDESTVTVTAGLERLCETLGLDFLDVSHVIGARPGLIREYHPNDEGHTVIARAVQHGLVDLGVLPQ